MQNLTQVVIDFCARFPRTVSHIQWATPEISQGLMVLVDGEAKDKLTNQHQLKLGLNYPIGRFTFRFTVNKDHLPERDII